MQDSRCKIESEIDGDPPTDIVAMTFDLATRIVRLAHPLERQSDTPRTLCRQILRSGTSIGANVEEAQGAQSRADFIAKTSIAQKEARETCYWLRLLSSTKILDAMKLVPLQNDAESVNRVLAKILVTAKRVKPA